MKESIHYKTINNDVYLEPGCISNVMDMDQESGIIIPSSNSSRFVAFTFAQNTFRKGMTLPILGSTISRLNGKLD